jgi:L-ascorbate metabolism protein UlaG (beta-lactamase superfamily)
MRVEWYGQSAFRLTAGGMTVFIDPFAIEIGYPAIEGASADLVLVTHEHRDHNGIGVVGGDPVTLRPSTWPRESPLEELRWIASEHDAVAGTQRGPNTIFRFELDGIAVCHFGDFGQAALRDEQAAAIGDVDLLFLPVGGGPTIGAELAAQIADRLDPRWIVPMHYRTHRIDFLETADAFLELMPNVHRVDGSAFDTADLPRAGETLVVLPSAP